MLRLQERQERDLIKPDNPISTELAHENDPEGASIYKIIQTHC